jgi:hypothetical protein
MVVRVSARDEARNRLERSSAGAVCRQHLAGSGRATRKRVTGLADLVGRDADIARVDFVGYGQITGH